MTIQEIIAYSIENKQPFRRKGGTTIWEALPPNKVIEGTFRTAIRTGIAVVKIDAKGVGEQASFSIEEIMATDWTYASAVDTDEAVKKAHAGLVRIPAHELDFFKQVFEARGYGIVAGMDYNSFDNSWNIYCESHLFDRPEQGKPTPKYILEFEEDTGTLTAKRISV